MRLTVVNLKGGTSKTTSAVFLATALARRGRALLVDTDPQGSALSWAEAAEEDGGDFGLPVVGLPVRDVHKKLKKFADDYEHVIIDTPPGEIPVVRSALLAADMAVVALTPGPLDLDRVKPTLELIAEVEPLNDLSFCVLMTRVMRITREGRDAREAMERLGLPVLKTEVPRLQFYSGAFGYPIEETGEYEMVVEELLAEEVTRHE